ncbi:hypothetical protein P692DRAFT_20871485 [Suillus brevipes Sb2]|nr:hypothetical protein P692DRAFT_20871485 [Suillus brevipes Sb2]
MMQISSVSPQQPEETTGGSRNAGLQELDPSSKAELTGHKRERQIFTMSLDGISMDHDYQDVLFTQYTIDTVIASYLAAKKRTRQYLQLMPEYEPLLSLRLAASQA